MSSPTLPTPTGAPACARGEARARPIPAGPGEELAGGSRPGRWRRTQRSARSAPRPDPLRAAPPPFSSGRRSTRGLGWAPGEFTFFSVLNKVLSAGPSLRACLLRPRQVARFAELHVCVWGRGGVRGHRSSAVGLQGA